MIQESSHHSRGKGTGVVVLEVVTRLEVVATVVSVELALDSPYLFMYSSSVRHCGLMRDSFPRLYPLILALLRTVADL